ncbi:hypothetical protein [Mycobacteroides abscessus]|uniref:hypothetical protein n=1 Tax=Mycobacteroides abscessus TaxID=36809 RepID=UPI0009A6477D|nr:hypothetical protein [Mycobacteroides abscessus]SKV22967.1 Uncharacterised protein [Mycobacteroides abscessus subsp. abscessus]
MTTTQSRECRPYAGEPGDEQIRIVKHPHLIARTIGMKGQPVLVVHRNLKTDKSSAMFQPVQDFLDRHPHEVIVGPVIEPESWWDGQAGELVFYRLTEYDAHDHL